MSEDNTGSGTAKITKTPNVSQCSGCQDGAVIPANCPRCGKPTNVRVIVGGDECMDRVGAGKVASPLSLPGPMVPLGLKTQKERSTKTTSRESEKKTSPSSKSRKSTKPRKLQDEAISPVPRRVPPAPPAVNLKEDLAAYKEGREIIRRHPGSYAQSPQLQHKQGNHMRAVRKADGPHQPPPKTDEGLGAKLRSAIQKCQCIAQSYNFMPGRGGNEMTGDDGDVRRPTDLRFEGGATDCHRCGHDHAKNPLPNRNYGDGGFKHHTALFQTDRYDHNPNNLGGTDQTSSTPLVFWKRSRQGNFGLLTAIGPDGIKYGLRIPLPARGEGTTKQEVYGTANTVLKPSSLFRVLPSPREDSRILVVMVVMFFMLTIATYVYRSESSYYEY